MMTATLARCATIGLATVLAIGCDEKPAAPANPNATASDPMVPATTPPLDKARDSAAATAADVTAKSNEAAADAGKAASNAGDSLVTQAQNLYDQAQAAIKKADFSGAQKYLDQLGALKSKLSPEWQAKITDLEKMVADGKAKFGGVTMPKLGQ